MPIPPAADAGRVGDLVGLSAEITSCRACPRLVEWREEVARTRRRAYRDQQYWGRPVPGFGDPAARILVLGLAPAAHGANRTGRVFTGDRSGDWLFRALHRAGLATQATSVAADDGMVLRGAWVTAAVRCAPPANTPTAAERDRCLPYLRRELTVLDRVVVVLALGAFAWEVAVPILGCAGRPRFGHGVEVPADGGRVLLGCYHPSQQNTFTGRLTEVMLDSVVERAVQLATRA